MATKRKTGDNPLGPRRVDTESGLESAIAELSTDVGFRSPKQSTTGGSKQVNNAVIFEPKRQAQIKARIPHAWWAYMFVEEGAFKAKFTPAYLADLNDNANGEVFDVFVDEDDQTREIGDKDIFYLEVNFEVGGSVISLVFDKFDEPEDTAVKRYIKIVEFTQDSIKKTMTPTYFRYDSIEWVTPKPPAKSYTIIFAGGSEKVITEEEVLEGYNAAINENWSLEFGVSGTGDLTGEFVGVDDAERYPDNGANPPVQTAYRLRIIKGRVLEGEQVLFGNRVSSAGMYQEIRVCVDGDAVTQLIKVG